MNDDDINSLKNKSHIDVKKTRNESRKKNIGSSFPFDLNAMLNNKFYKVLLGSYCILCKYCEPHKVEEFVEGMYNNYDLIIEFVKFISGQEIEENNYSYFDENVAKKAMETY